MNDTEAVLIHCRAQQERGEEISDACARTIAAMYHNGGNSPSASFATTGAITTATADDLWWDLFPTHDLVREAGLMADMMGTYLFNREDHGPVDGWASLWIR